MNHYIDASKLTNRYAVYAGAFLFFLAAFTLIGVFTDPRIIAGQNIWIKPLKFSFSMGIFLITMAWITQYLPNFQKSKYDIAFVLLMMIEILCIYIQALRGRASHHNFETPLDIFIYASMGLSIAVNTVLMISLIFHIQKGSAPLVYVTSIQVGLVLAIIGSLLGVIMSIHKSHTFGGSDGGPGIPFFNWSTLWGDLRVAHFIGLHGLQIMIATGYLINFKVQSKFKARIGKLILHSIFIFLLSLTLFTAGTAIAGLPFNNWLKILK